MQISQTGDHVYSDTSQALRIARATGWLQRIIFKTFKVTAPCWQCQLQSRSHHHHHQQQQHRNNFKDIILKSKILRQFYAQRSWIFIWVAAADICCCCCMSNFSLLNLEKQGTWIAELYRTLGIWVWASVITILSWA